MRQLLLVFALALLALPTLAQSNAISFTGDVSAINEDGNLVINGLTVNTSAVDPAIIAQLSVDASVTVEGTLDNGVVQAVVIVIISLPDATPEVTPVPPNAGVLVGNYVVVFTGSSYDGTSTTFTYIVTGTGQAPDLSNFQVEIPVCASPLEVVSATPNEAVEFGTDPNSGVTGIKWDLPLQATGSRSYSVTITGEVATGAVAIAIKASTEVSIVSMSGPACEVEPTATPEATAEVTPESTPDATPDPEATDAVVGDLPTVIIIEGPVQAININIVTIYNIDIELAPDDPALTIVTIGDFIRVEASFTGDAPTILVAVVHVVIVNVYVNTITGAIYVDPVDYDNDDGGQVRPPECNNPPPPWAPAHGWRRKCE